MRLYHTTTVEAAAPILQSGFKDGPVNYGALWLDDEPGGVWFANKPLGFGEGAAGDPAMDDPVLVVDIEETAITDCEWIEDDEPYREWLIPAQLANAHLLGWITKPDEADEEWWEVAEPKRSL
jgi:hypothetical protein